MLISSDDKRISPLFFRWPAAVVAYLAQHKQLNKQVHRTPHAHTHTNTQTAGATTRTCHTSLHFTEIQLNGIKTYLAPFSGSVYFLPRFRAGFYKFMTPLGVLPLLLYNSLLPQFLPTWKSYFPLFYPLNTPIGLLENNSILSSSPRLKFEIRK